MNFMAISGQHKLFPSISAPERQELQSNINCESEAEIKKIAMIAGVIGAIVSGILVAIGAFFSLAALCGDFLGIGPALSCAFVIGAGSAIGAYFLFENLAYHVAKLYQNNKQERLPHKVEPIKPNTTSDIYYTSQPKLMLFKTELNKFLEGRTEFFKNLIEKSKDAIINTEVLLAEKVAGGQIDLKIANHFIADTKNTHILLITQVKESNVGLTPKLNSIKEKNEQSFFMQSCAALSEDLQKKKQIFSEKLAALEDAHSMWGATYSGEIFDSVIAKTLEEFEDLCFLFVNYYSESMTKVANIAKEYS